MHPLYKIVNNHPVKRGPQATLSQARDEVLGQEVALKELLSWNSRPARARACFEFSHLRRLSLNHPGLAPVHGADCDRGWIVLDYYPEGSLADRLGPLPADWTRQVLVDVLGALAYLHDRGLVHGAVKPKNLFCTGQGQVLLADGLGLRRPGEGRAEDARTVFAGLDAEEAKYLAPECVDGKADRVGPPADLYALGLTVLELLLGGAWFAMLFPKVQVSAQRWDEWQLSDQILPGLRELLPDVPADLAEVIDGLLHKAPENRLSAAAALTILCPPPPAAAPSLPPLGAIPSLARFLPSWPQLHPFRPSPRVVASLAAGVLGLGLSWLLWPRSKPEPAPQLDREFAIAQRDLCRAHSEIEEQQRKVNRLDGDLKAAQASLERAGAEAEAHRARALALRNELATLKRANEDLERRQQASLRLSQDLAAAQASLTEAQVQIEEHRSRADRLTGELKSAQADLLNSRSELQSHRTRAERLEKLIGSWDPGRSGGGDQPSRFAVAAIKHLQGKVEVDGGRPDQAIVKVDLRNARLRNDHLAVLDGLTSLRTLDLSSTAVSDSGLAHLKGLVELHTLYLFDTAVSDAGLAHLKGLPKLRTLYLSTTRVGDSGLIYLEDFPNLRALHLTNTQVSDTGLVNLGRLSKLRTLHLSTTRVSDAGLVHLRGLVELRALTLSSTRVGNAGLACLVGLTRLETLDLSDTLVSDGGLAQLKGLTNLKEIDLARTQVSARGVAELRRALPNCHIQQ